MFVITQMLLTSPNEAITHSKVGHSLLIHQKELFKSEN